MNAASVKVISKEMIKPSSATPHSQNTLNLSFLDQLVPPFYVPVIFFYQSPTNKNSDDDVTHHLKKSLSDALTLFYPLAGKLDPENLAVVCDADDGGVEFFEARVSVRLCDVIKEPRMEELEQFLPVGPTPAAGGVLAVQVNYFECGGIGVGVCASHRITDAATLVAFMGAWAAGCRGEKGKHSHTFSPPIFDLARHFPPRDLSGSGFSQSIYVKKEKLVTKRFVFDNEKIAALKKAAISLSRSIVQDPTRVELVSAFIWKHIIETRQSKNDLSAAWHVVNLRPRISCVPLMENVFGNCILKQFIFYDGTLPYLHELVGKLRKGLREINDEYIIKAREDDDYLNDLSRSFELVVNGEMETCGFSSWCRFPVYEVDYGWGKPIWVCPTSCPEKNVCFLMSTKEGDGIEVWVNMIELSCQILETKFKLIGNNE